MRLVLQARAAQRLAPPAAAVEQWRCRPRDCSGWPRRRSAESAAWSAGWPTWSRASRARRRRSTGTGRRLRCWRRGSDRCPDRDRRPRRRWPPSPPSSLRQPDLGDVGVLELVDQDEARSLLRALEDRLAAAEQVNGAGDDVAESAEAILLQHVLELPIDTGDFAAAANHLLAGHAVCSSTSPPAVAEPRRARRSHVSGRNRQACAARPGNARRSSAGHAGTFPGWRTR